MLTDSSSIRSNGYGMKLIHHREAFTILELLVVIGIISILIGLALPTLGRARERAYITQSLSTIKQLHVSLTMYCDDNRNAYPYFATPGDPKAPLILNGVDISNAQGEYFKPQGSYWPSLARPYISGNPALARYDAFRESGEDFGLPPDEDDKILWSRFWLTHNAFALNRFWEDPPPTNYLRLRGMHQTDVSNPSQKGILLDLAGGDFAKEKSVYATDEWIIATGDGAARAEVLDWDEKDVVSDRLDAISWPVLSTRGGLGGRDPF